ncbi:MAG: sigma-54-dependent Fis family transcriptional regulator [Syntrophaceae bacterium]|nr:sigma-54-dependent Fis family transcriptional regulator [Syntrophaceae bacterium]
MYVTARDSALYLRSMFRRQIDYSLERSCAVGINQNIKKAPVTFSKEYINDRSEQVRRLVDAATPVLEQFHSMLELSRFVVAVADEKAVIIAGTGNSRWSESGMRCGFNIGTSCSEEYIGTNAIGTSLATGQPMCVIGEENYIKQWQDSANAATVIRDPFTGEVAGAVCLTCFIKHFHIFALGIVQSIAGMIEERLRYAPAPAVRMNWTSRSSIPSVPRAGARTAAGVRFPEGEDPSAWTRLHREFIFGSAGIGRLLGKARKAAQYDSTKLILGESGVGKEILAGYIHEHSRRRDLPFVAVNCAAIPPDLMASEFFGYEAGAFTGARRGGSPGRFEQAAGGSIYLDEISEMSMNLQAYLLRVIEDKTVTPLGGGRPKRVDVQIITSTNRDLREMVKEKSFRGDLYHRLNVISFHIPPLRERREDIPRLVNHFLRKMSDRHGGDMKEMSGRAMGALLDYPWPGNVRELENVIETACIFSEGRVIEACDLREDIAGGRHAESPDSLELRRIRTALGTCRWNLSRASRSLGMARSTLYRKMAKYRLSRENA